MGGVRVVRIIARLNVGGPAQHVVLLCRDLQARFPTLLVTGTLAEGEADMAALAAQAGVNVRYIPELGRRISPADDLVAAYRLWRLLRAERPLVVHTHTAKGGALGRLAAWLAGVPVIVHTYHGHVFHGYFSRAATAVFLAIERLLARITTRIVAVSASQRDEIAEYLGLTPSRITVVPLGLDLDRFAMPDDGSAGARFREAIGAVPGDVVMTVVGRLAPIKNQALAIRALAALLPRHPRLRLALVGGGESEASLRALGRELNVEGRISFAGWWSDLVAVYRGTDIVVLTSLNEGTPVCLIEALASGRPVVSTDVGGVSDVLEAGRFGVLVPAGDVAALSDAIIGLIEPASRARWHGVGASTVLARYGAARLAADVTSLYEELLSASR